ncbi:MAG: hypothetical protein V3T56_03970 [Gemmatimonadales bacterium]
MQRTFTPLALVLAAVSAACGANNVRPHYEPFIDAVVDTIFAPPDVVVDSLKTVVTEHGFEIARITSSEGFLETKWFDLDTGRSGGTYTRHPDRVIRFRFFAELGRDNSTVLRSEAAYRPRLDPSLADHEAEAMVPIDHPGDSLLQNVLDQLRPAADRGEP